MKAKDLAAAEQFILRPRDFDAKYAGTDFMRLERAGSLVRVARGAYVLVPEGLRQPDPTWRPPLERVALGLAASAHGRTEVALIGPSAARVHGCIPRAMAIATVSTPSTRPRETESLVGVIRSYRRTIDQMDVVHIRNDFVDGLVTSVEMTMLDLASKTPKWPIGEPDRAEAIRLLASKADWVIVDEIAARHRKATAAKSLPDFGVHR